MACYDWQAGRCDRGESCKFSHDGQSGGGRRSDRGGYRRDDRDDYRRDDYRRDDRRDSDRRSYRDRSRSRERYSRDSRGGGGGGIKVGSIRRLSDKGFGFIEYEGKSIFFHASAMTAQGAFDQLREGDEVEFEAGWDDRSGKDRAENVVML